MFESTRVGVVVVAAGLLAGCSSGDGSDDGGSGANGDVSMAEPAAAGASGGGGMAASPAAGGGGVVGVGDDLDDEALDGDDLDEPTTGNGAGGSSNAGSDAPIAGENAGSPALPPCTGCVELVAPVSGANSAENLQDQVGFQFNVPTPGLDFRNGRITWRLMALVNDDNLFVSLYAQNGGPDYSNVYPAGQAMNAVNFPPDTWVDVTLDLSAYGFVPGVVGTTAAGVTVVDPGTFDKTKVESFGIQLRAGGAPMGTRAIRVAVDSVTIDGVPGQSIRSFDMGTEGLGVNQYQVPLGTQPPLPH